MHRADALEALSLSSCANTAGADCVCRAATFGERDNCTGVSENIMLGQMCPLGTGSFDLLLNEQALQDAFEVQVVDVWLICYLSRPCRIPLKCGCTVDVEETVEESVVQ